MANFRPISFLWFISKVVEKPGLDSWTIICPSLLALTMRPTTWRRWSCFGFCLMQWHLMAIDDDLWHIRSIWQCIGHHLLHCCCTARPTERNLGLRQLLSFLSVRKQRVRRVVRSSSSVLWVPHGSILKPLHCMDSLRFLRMRPTATDGVVWSVSVLMSACLLVATVSHVKTDELIEMSFGMWTRGLGSPIERAKGHVWGGTPGHAERSVYLKWLAKCNTRRCGLHATVTV